MRDFSLMRGVFTKLNRRQAGLAINKKIACVCVNRQNTRSAKCKIASTLMKPGSSAGNHNAISVGFVFARCNVKNAMSSDDGSGDLFEKLPMPRRASFVGSQPPPELTAARALCRRLQRTAPRREKQRVVHLICLNLVNLLKRDTSF
jgi:hypothetical protein